MMLERHGVQKFARCRRLLMRCLAARKQPTADPELLLQQAQEEMRAVHARNRERAVQAITRKNYFLELADNARREIKEQREKASVAERRGQHEAAARCRAEAELCAATLESVEAQYQEALAEAEAVKAAIKAEEERIRQWTAEALPLRAQWRVARTEKTIEVRLAEITTRVQYTSPDELSDAHERNRAALVEAIKVRCDLEQMIKDTARKVDMLNAKAALARQRGDEDLERQLLRESESYEATLPMMRESLERSERMTERATALVREEEAGLSASDAATNETTGDSGTSTGH
jgi:phage shock protein A